MAIAVILYINKSGRIVLRKSVGRLWAFEEHSKLYKRIKLESNYILQAVHFNNFLAACVFFFYLPIGGQSDKVYYGIKLFQRVLPSYSKFLTFLYYCTFPILTYMVTINPYLLLYAATHMKFQVYYINKLLVNIAVEYNKESDYNLIKNKKYQKIVSQKLKICIHRHSILI